MLYKTNPADPNSPWHIGRDGVFLEFMNDSELTLGRGARSDPEGKKAQEWWIGQTVGKLGFT